MYDAVTLDTAKIPHRMVAKATQLLRRVNNPMAAHLHHLQIATTKHSWASFTTLLVNSNSFPLDILFLLSHICIAIMASRTLEARFERMSVNDENGESRIYQKSKVRLILGSRLAALMMF
jgi:hypothetical protein